MYDSDSDSIRADQYSIDVPGQPQGVEKPFDRLMARDIETLLAFRTRTTFLNEDDCILIARPNRDNPGKKPQICQMPFKHFVKLAVEAASEMVMESAGEIKKREVIKEPEGFKVNK